jgi:hypothetical protein
MIQSDLISQPLAFCILGQRDPSTVTLHVDGFMSANIGGNCGFKVLQVSGTGSTSAYASEGAMGVYLVLTFYDH